MQKYRICLGAFFQIKKIIKVTPGISKLIGQRDYFFAQYQLLTQKLNVLAEKEQAREEKRKLKLIRQ